ncbi:MAG: alpha/beta hydrolase [Planctomycetota bacterium]
MELVYRSVSWLLLAAYGSAPIAAAVHAYVQHKRGRSLPSIRLAATATVGVVLGVTLCVVYGFAIGGRAGVGQIALTVYLAIALLVLLKFGDAGLQKLLRGHDPGKARKRIAAVARLLVLVFVGLPAVMSAVMTYRVKVVPPVTPLTELGVAFQDVTFRADDGTRLAGWWIPDPAGNAERTVVLAHGLGGGKADFLPMAAQFVPHGYNVLMLDCRAHGGSGGQRSSFGKREARDVAAAFAWVVENRPTAARQLFGVGASMGAAALIHAAADNPDVDAIAVVGTYEDLGTMAGDATDQVFTWPVSEIAKWVALPLASAHAGTDLAAFRPADAAANLWPRPLLVVHAENDEIIPFRHAEALHAAAAQPKRQYWSDTGGHNELLGSSTVGEEIRLFFDAARVVRVAGK